MTTAILSFVGFDADIVEPFLRFHSERADRMILIDSGVDSATRETLKALQLEGLPFEIVTEDHSRRHRSEAARDIISKISQSLKPDWIIPLAPDEFLVAGTPEESAARLGSLDKGTIHLVRPTTYLPAPSDDPNIASVFRRIRHHRPDGMETPNRVILPGNTAHQIDLRFENNTLVAAGSVECGAEPTPCVPLHVIRFPFRSPHQLCIRMMMDWLDALSSGAVNTRRFEIAERIVSMVQRGEGIDNLEYCDVAKAVHSPDHTAMRFDELVDDPFSAAEHLESSLRWPHYEDLDLGLLCDHLIRMAQRLALDLSLTAESRAEFAARKTLNTLYDEIARLRQENRQTNENLWNWHREARHLAGELHSLHQRRSWRWTKPLRSLESWRRKRAEASAGDEVAKPEPHEMPAAPVADGRAVSLETQERRLFETYRDLAPQVVGWIQLETAALWDFLLHVQGSNGFEGHLMEIGVWYGKSALLLSLAARRPRERCLLVDRFLMADQVRETLALAHENPREAAELFAVDSRDLTREGSFSVADRSVRWMHIDGETSGAAVRSSLDLASRLLAPEGIVAVHGFFNDSYPQITREIFANLERHPYRFSMFLCGYGKAYLCRPEFFRLYRRMCYEDLVASLGDRGFPTTLWKTTADRELGCLNLTTRFEDLTHRGPDVAPSFFELES